MAEAVEALFLVFKVVDAIVRTAKLVKTNGEEMAALATRCLGLKGPLQAAQSRLTAELLMPLREALSAAESLVVKAGQHTNVLSAGLRAAKYSQRLVELNSRIGQCVSDLTLHLQLHGIEQSADGMQHLHHAIDSLRSATVQYSVPAAAPHSEAGADCYISRDAVAVDFDFSGRPKQLCSLSDAVVLLGRYEDKPVCVMEATAAAVQRIVREQQQGAGPSLQRLLHHLTSIVHPNIVEVKGGFLAPPPAANEPPKLTLVCEPFDQLLPDALEQRWSSGDKLRASTQICKGLSYLQSISRRFLLVPQRIAVALSPSAPIICRLLPNLSCDSSIGRWSPPEHAAAAWDGLTSPAAVMYSFGLLLMHIWGEGVSGSRLGPFALADTDHIRAQLQRVHEERGEHPFVRDASKLAHMPKAVAAAIKCCCCAEPEQRANAYQVLLMLEGIAQQDLDDATAAAAASATAAAAAATSGGHDSWSKVMEAAAAAAAAAAPPSAAAVNTTAPQSITLPHEVRHSGWLLKQRRHWGLGPDTHVRWFVLDNRRLMWFPDQEHSVQPSAFESAEAAGRCIHLDSGNSYVTDTSTPGGARSLEAGTAGGFVRLSLPEGGSAPQLDMWKLKLNKALGNSA